MIGEALYLAGVCVVIAAILLICLGVGVGTLSPLFLIPGAGMTALLIAALTD